MSDQYLQGWDDCLQAIRNIIQKSKDLKESTTKIERLRTHQNAKTLKDELV
jgi:hypothetical protein